MRTFSKAIVSFTTGLLLAGCAVGPDYKKPELHSPERFQGQQAVMQRRAAPAPDLASWWEGFGDPQMTELVARALAQNLDIAQATARVTQSRASLRSATAALLPSGDASAEAARVHESIDTPEGRLLAATPDFNRNGNVYEADLGASWEIDLFGGLRRSRQAAQAEYQASQAGVVATRLSVAAQTADTYVTIRGLQARLAVANDQLETQRRLLATVELQYAAGIAAELQVHQAKGALFQVEATIPVLASALDSAMNALDILLGTQPGSCRAELAAAAPVPVAPAIAAAGGPADLIRRRPDLMIAERKLAASNARVGAAVSEYYPKISLIGLLGTATTGYSSLFEGSSGQAQGVAGLRWRIFDFGRVDAEIAAARGRNAELLAAYRLAMLRASEDVEDAFSDLVNREEQERTLASGEQSLTQAKETSLAAYNGGVVSLIEVLDADSRLLQTRDARVQAQSEAAHAAIASFRALGGGWVPDEPS